MDEPALQLLRRRRRRTRHRRQLVERYTRVDKDQIDWEATVEDPNVLTKPWVLKTTMMLREGTRIEENVCENNVDVDRYEHLLKDGIDFTRQ